MADIIERYKEIKDLDEITNETDRIIIECFKYGIFKEKPTKSHKEWIKDCIEAEYPVDTDELKGKLLKEIKQIMRFVAFIPKLDGLHILRNMTELEQGYRNSLLVLAAYENDVLLGIIRMVGDGFTIVWIQDILVLPSRQRQGIGTALLKAVLF